MKFKLPFTRKTAAGTGKKKALRRKKKSNGDRLGQIIALVAIGMAAGYVIVRIIGWVRFVGV